MSANVELPVLGPAAGDALSGASPASPPRFATLLALLRKPLAVICLLYLLFVLFIVVFPGVVAPQDPLRTDVTAMLAGPSSHHLLGTDQLGRDVFSRLIYGARPMFIGCVEATAIALFLGAVGGMCSGYFRGRLDKALGWVIDLVLSIPVMIVLLVVLTINATDLTPAMVALGILISAVPLRIVRSVTLEARNDGYIAAARVAGLSHGRILVRHVLPRVIGPLIVQGSLASSVSLVMITGLAFLGLGVNPPNPTWGSSVSEAAQTMQQDSWLLIPTGGIIALTVLAMGLLGDSLLDVFNQRGTSSSVGRSAAAAQNTFARTHAEGTESWAGEVASRRDEEMFIRETTLLSVRDLTVVREANHGTLALIDGVSFDVMPGEIRGIVGESGSGKTLTARAILNLLTPGLRVQAGAVVAEGVDLLKLSRGELAELRRRNVSFVAQDPSQSLDPSFTVGKTLRESLRWREGLKGKAAEVRAVELLRAVRLPNAQDLLGYYPHQLSGGMVQRVAIAKALAGRPKLLVMDEPTTALDVTVQSEIIGLLRQLRDETGMAILFITHSWGVVADLCDRVTVMYAGEVVEVGATEEVFSSPLHPYTAALLKSSPYFTPHGEQLQSIPGAVPRPVEWPRGCRFQSRCQFATEACRVDAVPMRDEGDFRAVRCARTDEFEKVGVQ